MIPSGLAELCAGAGSGVDELIIEAWHIPADPPAVSGPAPLWGERNAFWVYVRRHGSPDRAAWQFVAVAMMEDGPLLRIVGEELARQMDAPDAFTLGARA